MKSKAANDKQEPVGKILNLTQVADRIGRHRNTIRRWIDDGLLPAVINPSGLIGVREEVVVQFYENNSGKRRGHLLGCELFLRLHSH
jgi:DNA-directed RNA polymerase specialized sigma54-like protein